MQDRIDLLVRVNNLPEKKNDSEPVISLRQCNRLRSSH